MLKLGRGSLTQGLVAVLCLVVITWLALVYFVPSPPSRVTIATGGKGTTFDYFGQRYRERFARAGVHIDLRERPPEHWKTLGFCKTQIPGFTSPL